MTNHDKGLAVKAALKFTGIVAIAGFVGVCMYCKADATPFDYFLYTVAGGVCAAIIYPTQDEGDALIALTKNNK